ncbi:hypothetical protein FRC10_012111 [Ceratobasidium sp. 414]|nr:hypothetical protein FRC10_012111 [Ceratobasidium sp. 414]
MKNQDGKGAERKVKRNGDTRCANRKGAKPKRRRAALDKSGLDVDKFGYLADTGFQSSDYSDSENKKRCVVNVPRYRAAQVNQLLGALDIKQNSMKKRTGNPGYTQFDYRSVGVPVPPLKTDGSKVLGWAVNAAALKASLEREELAWDGVGGQLTEYEGVA